MGIDDSALGAAQGNLIRRWLRKMPLAIHLLFMTSRRDCGRAFCAISDADDYDYVIASGFYSEARSMPLPYIYCCGLHTASAAATYAGADWAMNTNFILLLTRLFTGTTMHATQMPPIFESLGLIIGKIMTSSMPRRHISRAG